MVSERQCKLCDWIKNRVIKRIRSYTEVVYVRADDMEPFDFLRSWNGGEGSPLAKAAELRDAAEELVAARVAEARIFGRTWREIGDDLGVSHQAALKRYGKVGQLPLED